MTPAPRPGSSIHPSSFILHPFSLAVALLVLGLIPAGGESRFHSVLRALHASGPNRAERARAAGGYYAGLIDGAPDRRDELTLRLAGKPPEWVHITEIPATRYLDGDFLQFELLPDVDAVAFGARFTTNAQGLRDRPYATRKPPGTFRIVLLGSSMDMGWGVGTLETYENRFEDWLNAHAAKRGVARRFEVLNLAMAAYSPLHRLEAFARKAAAFEPDLVLYAATRLDTRLLQIHVLKLLSDGVDPSYDFVKISLSDLGIDPARLPRDARGQLRDKETLKRRLDEPTLWEIEDAAVGRLAALCRARGLPLACLLIPRASEEDRPEHRGPDMARIAAIARRHDLPVLDLSAAYDGEDPAAIEIAPWDDHPNARGHRLLFLELGRRLVATPALYRLLFRANPSRSLVISH